MRERLLSALELFDQRVPRGLMLNVILSGDVDGRRDPINLSSADVRYLTIRLFAIGGEDKGVPVRLNLNLDLELIPVAHC